MLKFTISITFLGMLIAPAVAQSEFNQSDLVCYMQTADGRTVDLSSLCGSRTPSRSPRPVTVAPPSSISPYSNLGGLEINAGGAGAKPCFGLDDQGKRCPTTR
ncbi:MAG: hypothetical protein KME07_00640 [Pegethrix bostrychoides GSE-TBD4-15B]|jgi:hypothetical protein|uniref:Uncharacterized protein n=1 Tax=Pegethrix bostrychoides GSE-TBD4-15B TaxID=2839662 RepID=A0A951U315_9CYAN|nr:hypothetical protein [Pegethrix bostrychoides GSE-TBD4-15B]